MAKQTALLTTLQSRFPDRSKKSLHALVLCGEISVDGEVVRDPKRRVRPDAEIRVEGTGYVSRGGTKLESAFAAFDFSVAGRVVLDAGASTGGFTDCILRHGAAFVHAVDSGHNQLAYALRVDPRVNVLEDTPVQTVDRLEPSPDVAVADISFRPITDVAPHILALTTHREAVLLLKPQFEWRKPPADFDGVVRREEDVFSIVTTAISELENRGVVLRAAVESPIRGRLGNREFLLHVFSRRGEEQRKGNVGSNISQLRPSARAVARRLLSGVRWRWSP